MSTGEFISDISVSKKGKANIQAVFLRHKDFGRKAFQRKRRLWDIKDVEQRLRSGHRHDLNHEKKPDSNSLAQPSHSTERHTDAESLSGAVQTKEVNKASCTDETQPSPPEFSTFLGFCHTSAEQDQAAPVGKFREESYAAEKDTLSVAEVNKEDSPQNYFGSELTHHTDTEEVTASHLENEKETSCQSPTAFGSHASPLNLKDDTHTVILKRHIDTGDPYAQYTQKVIQIRVTEFTVPGAAKKSGHETDLKSDPSAKPKSVCQPILCKILDQTEDILFPLSQTSDSAETQLQHNQACSTQDMLTSSVMTAFSPHWSARSRKQKQGVPDVNLNTAEEETHRRRQEVNLPSSVLSRDFPQHPVFGDPKLQYGDVFPEVSNKENAHSINGSKSSTDSLSNLFNLRNHGPGKRRLTRAFSTKLGGGQSDVKTDAIDPLTSPVDTVLRPVSPHSLDLHWSKSAGQPGQFSSMNPPPTTTGSLLLSLRQTNFTSSSTGTPAETYPLSSTTSLNSQKKSVSRMSEPLSYVTLQRNRKKSNLSPSQPLPNTINRPKGTSEFFPLSAFPEERRQESLRPRMFLYPNSNIEMSSPNTTSTTSDRGQTPSMPRYNKLDGTKNIPISPTPGSMLRRQQTLEADSMLQSPSPRSFALRRTHTLSNVSDFLNNNDRVRTMLAGDRVGTEPPAYSSGIYSGIHRPYDSLTSSNLNTLTSHTEAGMPVRGPQNVSDFSIYTRSNNSGIQQAKTVDIPTLSRRSKTASTSESPQTDSPVSPRVEYSVRHLTNLTSPLPLTHSTDAAKLVQQRSLNSPRPLFNRETYITDTQHSISNIDKNRSPVERAAISPLWQKNMEDLIPAGKQSPSSKSPCESPGPLSPDRPKRNICAPTTFSSLRCSSPPSPTSSVPPSPLLVPQRTETPVIQSTQDRKMQSESNPMLTPTKFSSISPASHTSPTSPSLSFMSQRRETAVSPSLSQDKNMQIKQSESSPVHIPTTFSSVRFSSPASHTSPTSPSLSLMPQRRETQVSSSLSQDKNIQLKHSESSPALTPTTFSSVRLSSPASHTSPTSPSLLLMCQRRETQVSSSLSQDKNIQLKHSESSPALTPTTFSSVRLSSPASHTSPTSPSLLLMSQRRETQVSSSLSQDKNIQLKHSESSPALTPTTFSSVRLSSPASHTSPTSPSSSLMSRRRETQVSSSLSQDKNIQLKHSESSPALTPTTFSSVKPSTSTTPSLSLLSQRRETISPPSQDNQTQLKRSESSPAHISSAVSKFNFDLSAYQRQRSNSKTDPTEISVLTGSSAPVPEKCHISPMNLSPYDSLLSARHTLGRASSPPITQRLRSPSFDSTVNTSKTGSTTCAPYSFVKFSKEQLGPVQPSTKQPVSVTSKNISDAKDTGIPSPIITLSPSKSSAPVSFRKENEKLASLGTDSVSKASPTQTEKKGIQPNQPVTQKAAKQESRDATDSISQKWSIFTSKNQRDGSSRGKENKPQTQPLEKTKKNSVGHRMDQMLDRMDQIFRSFTIKYREEGVNLKAEDTSLHQKFSSSRSSLLGNQERLESCEPPADKQVHPPSVSKTASGLGLFIQDQVTTKPPKPQKKNESNASLLKVPQPTADNKTTPQQKQKSSHVNQSATLPANLRTETNESDCSLFKAPQPIGDRHKNSLQKQKSIHVNQYATLPANWRTSRGSSNPSSPMDFYTEDVKSNRYLSNTIQPRRKTTSLCEPQDDRRISSSLDEEGCLPSRGKLSPSSDIKYGLNQNRSFSVSSVQSGRPSGTGRISRSSSRASSISDLTSAAELMTLDDLVTQETQDTVNPDDLCGSKPRALQMGPKNESPNRVWSPTSLEKTSFLWENECDPTPPPSPTFSPSTRRLSHAPSSSSQGSRTSQDSISPRGHLPSKNYTCSLSVFEESDSDSTTTDDEYYLDNENGEETEL